MSSNLHILIVDDDDKIRKLLRLYLVENNFLISTASNAAEAEELLKFIVFDLIVLDIMLSLIHI